ncbi:MAG: hypothetical protein ABFR05_04760 [Bacteroidota bacterium]
MKNKKTLCIPRLLVTISLFLILFSDNIYSQKTSLKVITIAMMEMGEVKGDGVGEAQLWYSEQQVILINNIRVKQQKNPFMIVG